MPKIFGVESFIDGLLPRFLICIIRDSFKDISSEEITDEDMVVFKRILERCYSINLPKDENGNNDHEIISLCAKAKEKFFEFQNDYIRRSRFLSNKAQVFMPKLISYAARLSGILHIINGNDTFNIDEDTVLKAIKLTNYYAGQDIRVLKFYEKIKRYEGIEIELIKTLYELQKHVNNGRLKLDEIVRHLNQKLPENSKQTNLLVSYLLRKIGLSTRCSVGYSFLEWDNSKIKRLFLCIETSTGSTASTDAQIENELLT